MKKRITIVIECETNKDNEYIKKAMNRGVYRGLDTTPYYVSQPKDVDSVNVEVEDI